MAILPGTRLGPYEITSAIGAGGMGEVYSARDRRLNRNVAMKVLPDLFAHDTERLARFEREAKLLASLNHPNIAAIHGLEESGSTRALVMELVEGPTLAERIAAGPIPLDEALTIAKQVAEALEYAHDHNVIHRDLKPANVKVTAEGTVKVLDFGLAKAMSGDLHESDMSNSPTLSMDATRQGVILGTAAYMSPEQARGKTVDRRTDVWAFGCVLYEMLSGRQPFQGEDITEVLAAVINKDPLFDGLPAKTPPTIRSLLRRCLEKNVRRRLSHVAEARMVIEDVLSGAAPAEPGGGAAESSRKRRRPAQVISLVAGLLAVVAIAVLATWYLKPSPPRPVTRTTVNLPPGVELAALDLPAVAISSDGRQLAYVATRNNVRQIYLRPMDGFETRPISGTESANAPFFSPDGQWIGFAAAGNLKKILVSGGAALTLASVGAERGATWAGGGTIVYTPTTASPLQQVLDAGGAPKPLTRLETGEITHRWPEILPGGDTVLFAAGQSANTLQLAAYSLRTGKRKMLALSGTSPHYARSGHLIYAQQGSLMAVPFDAQRLQITGTPVPVVEGVLQSAGNGFAQYALSADGSLVYIPGSIQATQRKLVWVDRKGAELAVAAPARPYRYPRISPDGQRVAVTIEEAESNVWLYDLRRDTLSRLTFEGGINLLGAWTPDGKRIAYASIREGGTQNPFWQPADGSGAAERLGTSEFSTTPSSFSLDGQLLASVQIRPDTGYDIDVTNLSDHKINQFLRTRFFEGAPGFSPDGRWLVYVSDQSGRLEIYVQPYPGPGGKWQISTDGGTEPTWSRNGREIFYRSGNKMMAVDIAMQPSFSPGKPHMLFEAEYVPTPASFPNYDVSPDGQRFLVLKPDISARAASTQINVVLNWAEELKRRVPTGTK
jgi:Tol biopolymer transport system component